MPDIVVSTLRSDHPDLVLQRAEKALSSLGLSVGREELASVIARLIGVDRWQDLFDDDWSTKPFIIMLDEDMEVPLLTGRLAEQSSFVESRLGLEAGDACDFVAATRATAHPLGPHFLSGLSASVSTGDGTRLEYRGLHPDKGPLVYRDGELVPFKSDWDAQIKIRASVIARRNAGDTDYAFGSVDPSTNDRVSLNNDQYGRIHHNVRTEGNNAIWSVLSEVERGANASIEITGPMFRPRLAYVVENEVKRSRLAALWQTIKQVGFSHSG